MVQTTKKLSILATFLFCALVFVACGDSGSSSSASSSVAPKSSSAAADPSEKFIGDWMMAGLELQGVTVIGDLSAMDVGTASLSIAADGTGTVTIDDESAAFTWKQADEDTLSIIVDSKNEETIVSDAAKIAYQDDTVHIVIESDSQTGAIIFSKNGSIEGLKMLDMSEATDITSEEALIGTWKVSAASYEGATMYGDSASLSAMNGSDEMVLVFEEGGRATMLGNEATWSIGENGAVISDSGVDIAVKALGDDIVMNVGEAYGMEMFMKFSK